MSKSGGGSSGVVAGNVNVVARLRDGRAIAMIRPAGRAFMVGYLLDALPTIFKHILRYVLLTLRNIARVRKRIAQERADGASDSVDRQGAHSAKLEVPAASRTTIMQDAVKPALSQLPALLQSIIRSLVVSLGPKGVAFTCALAMVSTTLMDAVLSSILRRSIKTAAPSYGTSSRLAFSTFVSAAISSSFALYVIQRDAIGDHKALQGGGLGVRNPFKRKTNLLPTPLAPGGHFLARLTSLSVPATPKGDRGSRSPVQLSSSRLAPPLSPVDDKSTDGGASPLSQSDSSKEELGTASPTIDLSLFALVRAMDTFVRVAPILFASRKVNLKGTAIGPSAGMKLHTQRTVLNNSIAALPSRALHSLLAFGRDQAEGLTFVVACAVIMYNWFYHPERLPPSYVKWISNLASMDHRLLEALRCLRMDKPHEMGYGNKNTPPAGIDLLGSLAESMGHPYEWGDISRLPNTRAEARENKRQAITANKPNEFILAGAHGPRGRGEMGGVPCELIHCGIGGPSCFKNALYRFLRAWRVCLGIYFPVHLLPRLIFGPGQFKREPITALARVLRGSMRSATFLSTYIASIWFMVCMARSVVLPRMFPNVRFQYWDGGLGPILGSWTCGWSVFIEEKRKRAEMALYVAPRALFALGEMAKPGWLSRGRKSALQTERLLFGMSIGVVVAAAKHRPDLLRGLTALMGWIVAPSLQNGVRKTAPRSAV
jgi:hypothetical protein